MKKVGLAVVRIQPFHNGHLGLFNKMMAEMDEVIICLGSAQESGTEKNPFTPKQRKDMIQKVYGQSSKIKIIEVQDIGTCEMIKWPLYVLTKIKSLNLPTPTHYYSGLGTDAQWFAELNNPEHLETVKIFYPNATAGETIEIRILDRYTENPTWSATEIRKSLFYGDGVWKRFVPECLVETIEESFDADLFAVPIDPEFNAYLNKKLENMKKKD